MTADDKALNLIPTLIDFYWDLYVESTWAGSSTTDGLPTIKRTKQVPEIYLDEADFVLAMLDIHDEIRLDLIATYRAIHRVEVLVCDLLSFTVIKILRISFKFESERFLNALGVKRREIVIRCPRQLVAYGLTPCCKASF